MVSSLNLNNFSVDENGRVTVAGISSGIDFTSAVDSIIAARRIPVDRLEASVESKSAQITALEDLRNLFNTLRTSLNDLRGRVTFGDAGDVFEAKDVFASTTATSGTPSAAGTLMGVSVTNAAATGSHSIELLQIAAAHQFSTDTAVSNTDNLGLAFGGSSQSVHGAFEINGKRITVEPGDNLVDLAERINNANTGSSASGVTASVVSVTSSQHVLVLTADDTGQSVTVAKSHRIGGSTVTSTTDDLGTALGLGANAVEGAFEINGKQIDVTASDTLSTLVTKINSASTGATASVLTVNGTSRLALTTDTASSNVTLDLNHRVGSGTATDTTSDLGTALGLGAGTVAGDFNLNGQAISVTTSDTLTTLRDKINAANAGATAKIITSGANNTLAITSDNATQQLAFTGETGSVLSELGISNDGGTTFLNELSVSNDVLSDLGLSTDGGSTFVTTLSTTNDVLAGLGISADGGTTLTNELRTAQNARFRTDGLIDLSASQTSGVASATTAFNQSGTLSITLPDNTTEDISVVVGDTPNSLRDKINASSNLSDAGITASVIQDDDGNYRVEIRQSELTTADPGGVLNLSLDDPATTQVGVTNTLTFNFGTSQIATINVTATDTLNGVRDAINADVNLTSAGVSATVVTEGGKSRLVVQHDADLTVSGPSGLGLATPELIVERSSNTVSDLFEGVTLSFFQAEVGTTVQLDIEQNLATARQEILDFVDAYNAVKSFLNQQRLTDPETGGPSADAGALFGNPVVGSIEGAISRTLGQGAQGLSSGFQVLNEIGIEFIDNAGLSDPLLADTLQIDETVLDEKLVNDPGAVRNLFAFDFSSSDSQVALLDFTGETTVKSGGYSLDVTVTNGVITAATIDGVANSTTISGTTITATNATGASGLKLVFTGSSSVSNVNLNFSTGVGSDLFFEVDNLLNEQTGSIQLEADNLTEQNELTQSRIDTLLERLAVQRQQLLDRYVAMEQALVSMNNTLDTIRTQIDALTADN